MNYPSTPHINIQNEIGFGKTVLMPGDPLRAKFIAENFLENPVLVNNVRGVQGHKLPDLFISTAVITHRPHPREAPRESTVRIFLSG